MIIAAAKYSFGFWINIVILLALVAYFGYELYQVWQRRRVSTMLEEADFRAGMRKAQVIDVREKKNFDDGHILGARNIPFSQLKQRIQELRPDLPVYLYDQGRSFSTRAALTLSKQGFKQLYILKSGFQGWTGKTKKSKY